MNILASLGPKGKLSLLLEGLRLNCTGLSRQESKGRRGARQARRNGGVGRAARRSASGGRKVLQAEMPRQGAKMCGCGRHWRGGGAGGRVQSRR